MTVPIVLGITIPLVLGLGILIYLHRRNVKRQRMEDAKDPHRDLDFGLDEGIAGGKKKKKGRMSALMGAEKSGGHKTNQLSMDMNLESPYLLPPQVHGSQDSVHTLTRGGPTDFDPYRMVNSECGSIRSFNPNKEGSLYGDSMKPASISGRSAGGMKMPPPRQGSFPRHPLDNSSTPDEKDPFATPPSAPEPVHHGRGTPTLQEPIVPIKPVVPEIGTVPYPGDEKSHGDLHRVPSIQEPSPAVAKSPEDRFASPRHDSRQFHLPGVAQSDNMDNIGVARAGDDSLPQHTEPAGLGLNLDLPQPMSPLKDDMFSDGQGGQGHPMHAQAISTPDIRHSKESDYGYQDYNPQIQTTEHYGDYEDYGRGRSEHRDPPMDHGEQPSSQGLGVPQQDNKRLSVGFRPLPPDEVTESEDPEYRANRIRSFYKEYFDDSKEAAPPMPQVPADYYGGGEYYEDYDQQYLGEAAYFDPETNAFVMPGAQPVHRRAMTPPPAGRRGPPGPGGRGPPGGRRGPRPPHAAHGSLGGMSLGPRPRAGSAWGSRAPSSLGPRPDSSASARAGRQTPRKNLPPPSALNTLPTPSKLKDDSFAIFNAADFAPPESFSERARGRSQSPLGERRPYSPKVPAASPLVTTYDELNALPSPHTLRKSSTFTGLDFLPPKKFKDPDTMSDAGSIASGRSAISSTAQSAIRMGAGRVSRLPGDTIFTQQAMANELKPQWGMRP